MTRDECILIVVDPTADRHPAIERGMYLAKQAGMRAELFICYYNPQLVVARFLGAEKLERVKQGYLNDTKERLTKLAQPYIDDDIDVTVKVAWDWPLYEGIVRRTLEIDARFVVKDTHYHSAIARALFTNTDWQLIRSCPAPLWLVNAEHSFDRPSILAAVDPMHDNDKLAELDTRILSEALKLATEMNGVVHVFHAFYPYINSDDLNIIEEAHESALNELAGKFEIPEDRVLLRAGDTADLLPQLVREYAVDLVIMGAISRSRLEQAIIGSTAENSLDWLPCDVLVIKPKGFISPVTFKAAPPGVILAD